MNNKSIFEFFDGVNVSNEHLFAITGDIDNLGLYVASNGRAKAECLVDDYNRIIESELTAFCEKNKIHVLLSLSGEEIFAIGYSCCATNIDSISRFLKNDMNRIISNKSKYYCNNVTISFGVLPFSNQQITVLKEALSHQTNNEIYSSSIDNLIYSLRNDLTLALDKEKFTGLAQDDDRVIVLYRNIVYAKMLQYKIETKKLLLHTSGSKADISDLICAYGDKYGVSIEEGTQLLNELYKK